MQGSTYRSGESHSEEEWEKMREIFVLLYKTQGWPLARVRATLAEKFGFHATLRQYKTRIAKWGETKTNNPEAPSPVGAARRQASEPGRRGQVVLLPQLLRLPPRRSLTAPGHLGAIHAATHGISRFYSGVLSGDEIDRAQVRYQNDEWSIRQFYVTATSIPTLTSASDWAPAQALYAQLLDHAVPLLQERNPIVAVCMLQICVKFYQNGQHAVLDRFLGFLMALVSAQGLQTHPLHLMASAWRKSSDHAMHIVTLCAEQAYDILKKQLGPEHPQTLAATRALHEGYVGSRDYAKALEVISATAETEAKLNFNDMSLLDGKCRVVRTLVSLNRFDEAAAGIEAIEATTCRLADSLRPEQLQLITDKIQATKAELLRHQLDPKAEQILSDIVEQYKPITGDKNIDIGLRRARESHLACVRRTLKSGKVEPFYLP